MYISICIPTYNSGDNLEKLLNSIKIQTFTDYEIIVSDDSPNDSVKKIIDEKFSDLNVQYYHNEIPWGSPNNWNNAVSKAQGEWIKLMHHDDWLTNENSLKIFAEHAKKSNGINFIFCAFQYFYLDRNETEEMKCSNFEISLLKKNYLNLYKTFMGNPSCVLINSKHQPHYYDPKFKWLIDYDFYSEFFKRDKQFIYINESLITLGIHSGQVTASVFLNPSVAIPETVNLLKKHGENILKNIYVYDFYWRMYRNLDIRGIADFNQYLDEECELSSVIKMLSLQNKIKLRFLKIGIISKPLMFYSYVKNYFK